jgi:hypothetical protein
MLRGELDLVNGTKPLCVWCGHCAWHGYCHGGYYSQPALEGCLDPWNCRRVTYAAEIVRNHQIVPHTHHDE